MADLFAILFTPGDDIARAESWMLAPGRQVSAAAGDDLITGVVSGDPSQSSGYSGCSLINQGGLFAGDGKDRVVLDESSISLYGGQILFSYASHRPSLVNHALIDLGSNDDQLVVSNQADGGNRQSLGAVNDGRILAGSGRDYLSFAGYIGLLNKGSVETGSDADHLSASGFTNVSIDSIAPVVGRAGLWNEGRVDFGDGRDVLRCTGLGSGLVNSGFVGLGADADVVDASGYGHGLCNSGVLSLGAGVDSIHAQSGGPDYYRINGSAIKTGPALVNFGLIDAGSDEDLIEFSSTSGLSLLNRGAIRMGTGNDVLRNVSPAPYDSIFSPQGARPVKNLGVILMGPGDDLVDSLISPGSPGGLPDPGFVGRGLIDMGSGNDTFRGFGDGHICGGDGLDTLILPIGTYAITPLPGERFRLGARMTVSGFERFGEGADRVSFAAAVVAGSVTFS